GGTPAPEEGDRLPRRPGKRVGRGAGITHPRRQYRDRGIGGEQRGGVEPREPQRERVATLAEGLRHRLPHQHPAVSIDRKGRLGGRRRSKGGNGGKDGKDLTSDV